MSIEAALALAAEVKQVAIDDTQSVAPIGHDQFCGCKPCSAAWSYGMRRVPNLLKFAKLAPALAAHVDELAAELTPMPCGHMPRELHPQDKTCAACHLDEELDRATQQRDAAWKRVADTRSSRDEFLAAFSAEMQARDAHSYTKATFAMGALALDGPPGCRKLLMWREFASDTDANFIEHARTDVPALATALRAALLRVADLEREVELAVRHATPFIAIGEAALAVDEAKAQLDTFSIAEARIHGRGELSPEREEEGDAILDRINKTEAAFEAAKKATRR